MKLYFVRHGESEANLEHVFSNRELNHPLTSKGIQQAHDLAVRFRQKPISRILSSPILRAVQTAAILATAYGLVVEINSALREWDVGIYEGTTDPQGWECHRQVQEDWFIHRKLDRKMPGGESFLEIQARFLPFIDRLIAEGKDTNDEMILVGHGGLFTCMLPVLLTNISFADAYQASFANTAYVAAEPGPSGLVCTEWLGTRKPPEASSGGL